MRKRYTNEETNHRLKTSASQCDDAEGLFAAKTGTMETRTQQQLRRRPRSDQRTACRTADVVRPTSHRRQHDDQSRPRYGELEIVQRCRRYRRYLDSPPMSRRRRCSGHVTAAVADCSVPCRRTAEVAAAAETVCWT